ncbi:hypothetical protein B1B_11616, partial [mine drainage metagenome]
SDIRRLCQNKLYFRQSADVAKYAANDLIFNESEYDKILDSLKTLGQRECAINAVEVSSVGKSIPNSAFARVMDYAEQDYQSECKEEPAGMDTTIRIIAGNPDARFRYEIYYLGERIRVGTAGQQKSTEGGLLPNKKYRLVVLGDKKKDNREFRLIGGTYSEFIVEPDHKSTQ